jgi:hypothetical protein
MIDLVVVAHDGEFERSRLGLSVPADMLGIATAETPFA